MAQGSFNPINRFLGQKVCSVAWLQTDRHTHTKVTTEGTLSGFQEFFLQSIIKHRPNNQHSCTTTINNNNFILNPSIQQTITEASSDNSIGEFDSPSSSGYHQHQYRQQQRRRNEQSPGADRRSRQQVMSAASSGVRLILLHCYQFIGPLLYCRRKWSTPEIWKCVLFCHFSVCQCKEYKLWTRIVLGFTGQDCAFISTSLSFPNRIST